MDIDEVLEHKRLGWLQDGTTGQRQWTVPCRLPGCPERFVREVTRGPNRYFHSRTCAQKYQRRRVALDVVVRDHLAFLDAEDLSREDKDRVRSSLRWVLGMRSAYEEPESPPKTMGATEESLRRARQAVKMQAAMAARPARPRRTVPLVLDTRLSEDPLSADGRIIASAIGRALHEQPDLLDALVRALQRIQVDEVT